MIKSKCSVFCVRSAATATMVGVVMAIIVAWAQAAPGAPDEDLHIPRGRPIASYYNLTDGSGFLWDFNSYGSVQEGTQYSYSSGMMLLVGDKAFRSNTAWANEDGTEFELGPTPMGGLTVHRRIRVYDDLPLARWLDILTNNSSREISTRVTYRTGLRYGLSETITSSGDAAWSPDDWWVVTATARPGTPSLLHVVCDERSEIRPDVIANTRQIMLTYDLKVPPQQTVVLCHFESQNRSQDDHMETIEEFSLHDLLKDLPADLRARILNFRADVGLGAVSLNRSEKSDVVVLNSGDVIYGTIGNEQFVVEAFFDTLTMPAGRVIGMAVDPEQTTVRTALTDGQIVCGKLVGESLSVTLSTGGQMDVPLSMVQQWSYRIDEDRPAMGGFTESAVLLQTGDLLIIDADDLSLAFRTTDGVVPLTAADLQELRLADSPSSAHEATLINGTTLVGLLDESQLTLSLAMGKEVTVRREMIRLMRIAAEAEPDSSLTQITMTNGSVLMGSLVDKRIPFRAEFGGGGFTTKDVRSIEMSSTHLGRAKILLWDETVLRGEMTATHVDFQIVPGPTLTIATAHIASIVRPQATPRDELQETVTKHVARLGAESYTDREAASESLKELGGTIIPLLQEHLSADDPEVRRRVAEIIEHLMKQR